MVDVVILTPVAPLAMLLVVAVLLEPHPTIVSPLAVSTAGAVTVPLVAVLYIVTLFESFDPSVCMKLNVSVLLYIAYNVTSLVPIVKLVNLLVAVLSVFHPTNVQLDFVPYLFVVLKSIAAL